MSFPSDFRHRRPRHPGKRLQSLRIEVAVSLITGLVIAAFWKRSLGVEFLITAVASSFVGFLSLHFLRDMLVVPAPDADDPQPDPARLTESITSGVQSNYAISSNWITLWRSPIFRYYLHLDTTVSLVTYSQQLQSPLLGLSTNKEDRRKFYEESLELAADIAGGRPPVRPHRLRLLIYPKWVYESYPDEMLQLIGSHSAGRIPCIPLLADELYRRLTPDERQAVGELVRKLGQTTIDKAPPRARLIRWILRQRLRFEAGLRPEWAEIFPDMLLVDVTIQRNTSALWWYVDQGELTETNKDDPRNAEAYEVFRIICRNVPTSLWAGYAPNTLGYVPVAATPDRLDSEAFFAREYYEKWLDWITENKHVDTVARRLDRWMSAERVQLSQFIRESLTAGGAEGRRLQLLDIGCGTGRDIVLLLDEYETLQAVGVDIIDGNVLRATTALWQAGFHSRAHVVPGDAAKLEGFIDGEVDIAICMTNTLGNLPQDKQQALVRRLVTVLRPGGQVLFSVYSLESVSLRVESYAAIGLNVDIRDEFVRASEGLSSQYFTGSALFALLTENGLEVTRQPRAIAGIGLTCVARRPEDDARSDLSGTAPAR